MNTLISLASLALASTAHAAPSGAKSIRQIADATNVTVAGNMTLSPIVANITEPADETFTPKTEVALPYGVNNTNFVNVTLTVPAAVLLESISHLTTVDCATDSVSLTFEDADDVNLAFEQWSAFESLVLITNHMGDCDTEFERGFFVATTYAITDLTLVASVEKTNVSNFASKPHPHSSQLPVAHQTH